MVARSMNRLSEEILTQLAHDLVVYGVYIVMVNSEGNFTRIDPTNQMQLDGVEIYEPKK
jgi:hypothetical protein